MRKPKVVLDFIRFSVPIKYEFYLNITAKLTGNSYFTTPDVPIADAVLILNKVQLAMVAAEDGGYTAKSHLKDVIKEADAIFTRLAHYVDRLASADETKILSSGFHVSKQPTPAIKAAFALLCGRNLGSLIFTAKQIQHARACIWQLLLITDNPSQDVYVTVATTTAATYEHEGLLSGRYYKGRMAFVTPEGTTDFCEPITILVR